MTRLRILALLAAAILGLGGAPAADPGPSFTYCPGIVLIRLRPAAVSAPGFLLAGSATKTNRSGLAPLDQLLARYGMTEFRRPSIRPANIELAHELGLDRDFRAIVSPEADIEKLADDLNSLSLVEEATPNWIPQFEDAPNDPYYPLQWGHDNEGQFLACDPPGGCLEVPACHDHGVPTGLVGFDANVEDAWEGPQGYGSASIVIGIIDSGVDLTHPDLRLVPGYDFACGDDTPEDTHGHGTNCAGVAAAIADNGIGVAGVAGGCSIMPLKITGEGCEEGISAIRGALIHAADHYVDIVSMSFTEEHCIELEGAITYADRLGVVLFACAGNYNRAYVEYPARYEQVIAVGAASPCGERKRSGTDPADFCQIPCQPDPMGVTCDGDKSWGSSYGPELDLVAPCMIPTTDIQRDGGRDPTSDYNAWFPGTSAATPFAAGVAALYLSINPYLSPSQIRKRMQDAAIDITSGDARPGKDLQTGNGLVNAPRPPTAGSGTSAAFGLYLGPGYRAPGGSGVGVGVGGAFVLALGPGFRPPTPGGQSFATSSSFALYLGLMSEAFALSSAFPLDTGTGAAILEPTRSHFLLTGAPTILRVRWTPVSEMIDHMTIRYSSDPEGEGWPDDGVLATGVPGSSEEWTGAVDLPAADAVGAMIRLERYAADGSPMGSSYSDEFHVGNEASIRLNIERNGEPYVHPPVLWWPEDPTAERYEFTLEPDGATSCGRRTWNRIVNAPWRSVSIPEEEWSLLPPATYKLTVRAIPESGPPGQPFVAMRFQRVQVADLDPGDWPPSKPPVLLVHGWTSDQSTWYACGDSPLLDRLAAEGLHPWAIEYPNIGSIRHAAAGLARAVEYLRGLHNPPAAVRLVAHSMGGLVCRALLQGFAVDPLEDPILGPRLPRPEGGAISHLATLSSPHFGEPGALVQIAAASRQISCPGILTSWSAFELRDTGLLIAQLNDPEETTLPGIRLLFTGGTDAWSEDRWTGIAREAILDDICPFNDATVDLCSARGDCGGLHPWWLAIPPTEPGGVIARNQYFLSHSRMSRPGRTSTWLPDCGQQRAYGPRARAGSLALLDDLTCFLLREDCTLDAPCGGPQSTSITIAARRAGGSMGGRPARDTPLAGVRIECIPDDAVGTESGALLWTDAAGVSATKLPSAVYAVHVAAAGSLSRTETLTIEEGSADIAHVLSLYPDASYLGPRSPRLAVNGGAPAVTDSAVVLSLSCEGATEVVLSDSLMFDEGAWMSLQPEIPFVLHGGPGVHEISAMFRDTAGRRSDIVRTLVDLVGVGSAAGISVTSAEETAEVILDGMPTGTMTPALLSPLAPGYHRISLSKPGMRVEPALVTVAIDSATVVPVAFTLQASTPPEGARWRASEPDGLVKPGDILCWERSTDPDSTDLVFYDSIAASDSLGAEILWTEIGHADTCLSVPLGLPDSARVFFEIEAVDSHRTWQVTPGAVRSLLYDASPPQASVLFPAAGDTMWSADSLRIRIAAQDWSGIESLVAMLSLDGGRTIADTIHVGAWMESIPWVVPTAMSDSARVICDVADQAGHVTRASSESFSIVDPLASTEGDRSPVAFAVRIRPNPSTRAFAVTVDLPQPSVLRIEVFDVSGRRVRRITDGHRQAGTHPFVWNGLDEAGRVVRSGVYLCRVRGGSRLVMEKIVLVR